VAQVPLDDLESAACHAVERLLELPEELPQAENGEPGRGIRRGPQRDRETGPAVEAAEVDPGDGAFQERGCVAVSDRLGPVVVPADEKPALVEGEDQRGVVRLRLEVDLGLESRPSAGPGVGHEL